MSEMPMAAAVACAGAAAWLMGGPYSGAGRAQLLLAGGGVAGSAPPPWRQLTGELRKLRGRWRPEWWAPVAGLVLALLGGSVLPVVAGAAGVPLLRRVRHAAETRRAGSAEATR